MNLLRYRFLLEQLVRRNFNTKYRQSILGVLWSFLNPLLTMGIQYIVFSTLFRGQIDHFPVYLLSGIILFAFFNETCTLGLDSVVLNGSLISKVAVPKIIFPLSRSLSSLINLVISLLPLLVIMLIDRAPLSPALLALPGIILLTFLFALGMALILCTLNVFFRDVRFLWSVLSLLWTYATPIFYPIAIIPDTWRPLFQLNPMYQFITAMRTVTIDGAWPGGMQWLICLACALIPLAIGWWIFRKNEDQFVFHL